MGLIIVSSASSDTGFNIPNVLVSDADGNPRRRAVQELEFSTNTVVITGTKASITNTSSGGGTTLAVNKNGVQFSSSVANLDLNGEGIALSLTGANTTQVTIVSTTAYTTKNQTWTAANTSVSTWTFHSPLGLDSGVMRSSATTIFLVSEDRTRVLVGVGAGAASTSGTANTLVGNNAGNALTTGAGNTFVGSASGSAGNNLLRNTFIGTSAGRDSLAGANDNACVGNGSCLRIDVTDQNTAIGRASCGGSGSTALSGNDNFCGGYNSGGVVTSAARNVLLGSETDGLTSGTDNVFLGRRAGRTATTATNSIAIGSGADFGASGLDNAGVIGTGAVVNSSNTLQIGTNMQVLGSTLSFSSGTFTNLTANTMTHASAVWPDGTVTTVSSIAYTAKNQTWNAPQTAVSSYTFVAPITALAALIRSTNTVILFVREASSQTAVGPNAGGSLTTGANNTLFGSNAGFELTTGVSNTIVGSGALSIGNNSNRNTFMGALAGRDSAAAANDNTCIGQGSCLKIDGADRNTAIGVNAGTSLSSTMSGTDNFAGGYKAGSGLTSGSNNVLIGSDIDNIITGSANTFLGYRTGRSNTPEANNILIGASADLGAANLNNAIGIGAGVVVTSSNTLLTNTRLRVVATTVNPVPGIYTASFSTSTSITSVAISTMGHLSAPGAPPTLGTCGTSPSIVGSDIAFSVTVGGTTATCDVTFAVPYNSAPTCVVTERTMSVVNAFSYTVTATGVSFSQVGLNGNVLDVHCIARY